MARGGRGADDRLLEPISLDGTPLPPAGSPARTRRTTGAPRADRSRTASGRRHLLPWVGAATIALVAALVLPVRAKVAVAELGTVTRGWTTARATVDQRQAVVS